MDALADSNAIRTPDDRNHQPALDELFNQTTTDVRGNLNHAFLLAAGLVILALVCAVIYRVVAGRVVKKPK